VNEATYTREKIKPVLLKSYPRSIWMKVPGSPFNLGMPDLIGCWEGRAFYIEVKKAPNVHPTALQKDWLLKMAGAGAAAMVLIITDKGLQAVMPRQREPLLTGPLCPWEILPVALEDYPTKALKTPKSVSYRMNL
jgi:hypothetical protein